MPRDENDDHLTPETRGASSIRRSIEEATDRMFDLIEEAARAASNIRSAGDGADRDEIEDREDERREVRTRSETDGSEEAERLALDRVNAISRLADSLVEYADQVRYESERLLTTLGDKARGVARRSPEPPPARRREQESYEEEEDEPPYEPEPRRPARRRRRRGRDRNAVPEEAMLRATQMAVAGSSRGAIERFLVEEYGVDDPDPILDSVLGTDR